RFLTPFAALLGTVFPALLADRLAPLLTPLGSTLLPPFLACFLPSLAALLGAVFPAPLADSFTPLLATLATRFLAPFLTALLPPFTTGLATLVENPSAEIAAMDVIVAIAIDVVVIGD